MGCAFSHIALWNDSVTSGQSVVVFEDDVEFHPDIDSRLPELLQSVPEDADVLLFRTVPFALASSEPVAGSQSVRRVTRQPFSLCGYAVRPQAAAKLMQAALPVRSQIDATLVSLVENGSIRAYAFSPPMVIVLMSPDDTDVQRFSAP